MNLQIFDSILHKTLRPWLENNPSQREVNNILKSSNYNDPKSFSELQNQIENLLSIFSENQSKLVVETRGLEIDLQQDFFQITFDKYPDNFCRLYYYIITKEAIRILSGFCNEMSDKHNDIDSIFCVKKILKTLKSLLAQTAKELRRESNQSLKTTSIYVLDTLFKSQLKLYFEIQERYKHLLTDIETEENLKLAIQHESPLNVELVYIISNENSQGQIINSLSEGNPSADEMIIVNKKSIYPHEQYQSFTLVDFAKKQDKLGYLFESLKTHSLVADSNSLPVFRQIFSGKAIKTPVIWKGNINELNCFIKTMIKNSKEVNLKQKHWEVACLCFVDELGNKFDKNKLARQKSPAKASIINKLVLAI